jgi:hypothetical protein
MESVPPGEEKVSDGQALHGAGEVNVTAEKNADGKEERANFEAPRRSWSTFARRTPKIKCVIPNGFISPF